MLFDPLRYDLFSSLSPQVNSISSPGLHCPAVPQQLRSYKNQRLFILETGFTKQLVTTSQVRNLLERETADLFLLGWLSTCREERSVSSPYTPQVVSYHWEDAKRWNSPFLIFGFIQDTDEEEELQQNFNKSYISPFKKVKQQNVKGVKMRGWSGVLMIPQKTRLSDGKLMAQHVLLYFYIKNRRK